MSHGTSACFADVIDVKHVKKICLKEYKNFLKVLKEQQVDLEDFAQQYQYEELQNDLCVEAWNKLADAFELKTRVDYKEVEGKQVVTYSLGLTLGLGFHDVDEQGDKYDEVDGVYFTINGAYELTPAGKKFNSLFERKFFTEFG